MSSLPRFYDNRQKYLSFVASTNEKWRVAERAAVWLDDVVPSPPAFRVFDAGVGDATVLSHFFSAAHEKFPNVPFSFSGKEVSLEDMRVALSVLPSLFVEHPASVFVFTNMFYAEAPFLMPAESRRDDVVFKFVEIDGSSSFGFDAQLRELDGFLSEHWSVSVSEKSGNPVYDVPTVLVLYRSDHAFSLSSVLPVPGVRPEYDFVLASQPWRSRQSAEFKASHVLAPLCDSLASGGLLFGVQSAGEDPALELVRRVWPDEVPFPVDRFALLEALREVLDSSARDYDFLTLSDSESRFRYDMHSLPDDFSGIGTSSLFAAWNAAVYVAQMEDERVDPVTLSGGFSGPVSSVLSEFGGLWFFDESFVVKRH